MARLLLVAERDIAGEMVLILLSQRNLTCGTQLVEDSSRNRPDSPGKVILDKHWTGKKLVDAVLVTNP